MTDSLVYCFPGLSYLGCKYSLVTSQAHGLFNDFLYIVKKQRQKYAKIFLHRLSVNQQKMIHPG